MAHPLMVSSPPVNNTDPLASRTIRPLQKVSVPVVLGSVRWDVTPTPR